MQWSGKPVLVTGAGGFIGGHVAVALNRAGARVRALCRYNSRTDRGALSWFGEADTAGIDVTFGDVRDAESVRDAMTRVDVVFHLAAQIAIPYSFVNPRDFVATNVEGTLNVAQAARLAGVERVLHLSTSEVYGNAQRFPIDESHRLAPRSPYAASKVAADMLMESFHHSFELPVVTARPFNTYGPHQSARAIVPTILTQALAGTTLRLGSLESRRDLTFVADTVAALLALAADPGTVGQVVQIGTGSDASVAELVSLAGELVGRELEVAHDPQRVRPGASEVSRLLCDPTRLMQLTGWRPQTGLRDGVAATLAWIEANRGRFRAGEYAR